MRKMKILQKKSKITALLITVILMFSTFMVLAQAQEEGQHGGTPETQGMSGSIVGDAAASQNYDYTYPNVLARLAFTPNPVGVNQIFTINLWTTPPPSAERFRKDYRVVITKPDGQQNTVLIDSYVADGTAWFPYLADQVGDWTLQFFAPGQFNPAGYYNDGEWQTTEFPGSMYYDSDYYPPCNTPEQTLTVQEEFVYSWPLIDLPTDYWTRPISMEHREWAQIAGNYPWEYAEIWSEYSGDADWYGPYCTAPNTSHVVWKKQDDVAGIIGGEAGVYGDLGSVSTPNVIYMGRCYDTYTVPGVGSVAGCYDLRTGEIYYEIPTSEGGVTPIKIAYTKPADNAVPGAGAARPITATLIGVDSTSNPTELYHINPWDGTVRTFDLTSEGGPGRIIAFRGSWFLSVRDSSDSVVDPYMMSHFWNRTSIQDNGYPTYLYNWSCISTSRNFEDRLTSNITYRLCPSFRGSAYPESSKWNWYGRMGTADLDTGYTVITRRFFDNAVWGGENIGVSLISGEVLWERFYENAPYSPRTTVADEGVAVICFNQGEVIGLDMATGNIKWSFTGNSYPFGGFWGYDEAAAYGMAYFWSYDGVQAYDLQNGGLVWHYNDFAVPFETTYTGSTGKEAYSFNGNGIVADGKVYTRNSEHTATAPYTRGWSLHCIDAYTGEGIWKIGAPMNPSAAADGYLTAGNSYDGYMYVFGKGESELTVSAPMVGVAKGSPMMITGSVLDMSPAQAGTACVSVDSMDTQMDYIHVKRPIDGLYHNETINGVPVTLTAIGEDGSYVEIGTTTSDGYYGNFGMEWTPENEGVYEIIASFDGSDAYGSSVAATKVVVGPAAAAGGIIEPEHPLISTDMAIIIAVVAVAIIAAVAYLALRRRK
jgi:outer membrane protein assembly factor BamB